jgi:D-alanine-D-alanine ligase-like ATP-grasp enzyme
MASPQSIEIINKFLFEKGYGHEEITLAGKRFIQIKKDGQVLWTADYTDPLYPFITSSARLISKHKDMAYDFVQMNGITIPKTAAVQSSEYLEPALSILEEFGSVIVKPKQGSGSKGLYLNIKDEDHLRQAIEASLKFYKTVLVQQQLLGEEVRFAVANGKVQGVLLRQKPYVTGDGVSTVADLIEEENRKRLTITDTLVPYPQLDETLVDSSLLYSDKVLTKGERQELNKNTMIRGGASMFNITNEIHPGYKKLAEKAAAFGGGFIVVDMMIQDEKAPPTPDNYGFIEFNLVPALSLFYSCRDGKHLSIVEDYLGPMIMKAMQGTYV